MALSGCVSVQRDASLDRTERPHAQGLRTLAGTYANRAAPDSSYATYTLMQFLVGDAGDYDTVRMLPLKPDMWYVTAEGGTSEPVTLTLLPERHFRVSGGRLVLPEAHWPRTDTEPPQLTAYVNAEGDLVVDALVQRGGRFKGVVPYAATEARFWYFERIDPSADVPAAAAR